MKKIIRKVKGKKVLSFVLAAIMLATTFSVAVPMLKLDVSAADPITITAGTETVTQKTIVGDDIRNTIYDNYAAQFLNGASNPTNIVIPGLQDSEDYVIQGMTYYPEKDWMLITAYHGNCDSTDNKPLPVKSSKVFALDAATGEFVAMFSFRNPPAADGTRTLNTEHGGGIAVSENNIYYACGDDDREIAYAPLSELDLPDGQTYGEIELVASVEFNEIGSVTKDGKTGYTAYVCFDNGILWTGNFFDEGAQILPGFDITSIANGYNAPANKDYNSMVFGYRLAGNSPEEEWNYLMGNVNGKDCRGNPSYVIGLNNSIRDVQYAVVDNGKIYLSCSFGTGGDNLAVSYAGMDRYSSLIVADIDLTQPGTKQTKINTHKENDKIVWAYDIQNFNKFDMMPMSEGLCVVNDNLFITFESASRKYRTDAAGIMGNCDDPVDVVWQVDPYELMETTVAEPEKSIYYEKVYSLTDIKDGDEYIIVHESKTKDPVSQKNYLYALNAKGNFKGLELSKSEVSNIKGYDGMIGHPISYYSFEKGLNNEDILYLGHPENDDIENIRWTITKTGEGVYSIKNTSPYFANYNSLYFDSSKITMMPNNANQLSNIYIGQMESNSGYFYLSNNGQYYLWCNDDFDAYNTKANAYYANNAATYPLLDGVTEVAGTFHCDARNISGSNIIGQSIPEDSGAYTESAFQIYRRVVDEVASTYESRVYTDLDAELQADGTYTVTLETFAISPNHYQYVGERPTDYIIVADASSSMNEGGSTGIKTFTTELKVGSMISDRENIEKTDEACIQGYAFCSPTENIHFLHESDGKYYKGYMAVRNAYEKVWYGKKFMQYYYVYYIADDGYYYCLSNLDNNSRLKYTEDQFKSWVAGDNGIQTASSDRSNIDTGLESSRRVLEPIVNTVHYRFDDVNSPFNSEYTRISTLKTAATDLVDGIAAQNKENRIALVQYGSGSSYLAPGGWASSNYADAFWKVDNNNNVNTLKTQISNIGTTTQTSNDGIELEAANTIIDNSNAKYDASGDRNVAIILISDGIPGADGGSSTTAAANAVIQKALTAKNKGAFIYTVLIGNNSVNGFNKKAYMDGVSSKYAASESLTSLGGQSIDGVNYALSLATTTANNFFAFGENIVAQVNHNSSVGLDNLDVNSYLREQLSDAFKFPADNADETPNYTISVDLITGVYDEVGRFSFEEDTATSDENVTDAAIIKENTEVNTLTKTLEITKYDYAKEYIAKSKPEPGRKLRVKITGLLADETADIRNTSISNTDTTAIYKTETDMINSTAFKKLPTTYFNIPKYTYVLDYGLDMLDTNVNGTLCAVSNAPTKQNVADYKAKVEYTQKSANGLVKITNESQDLLYHTTPTNMNDSGYVLIQRPTEEGEKAKYDWFEIKVVPASNVYFEEDDMNVKATDASNTAKADWTDAGEDTNKYRPLAEEGDVVGFDNAYDDANATYSNGNALTATVTASQRNSKTQTFDFVGTGFDLVSRCGSETGILLVNIKNSAGKSIAASLVDTYCEAGTFNQTPVFSWSVYDDDEDGNNKGTTYGTYTVEVSALYLSNAGALNAKSKSINKSSFIDTGLEMKASESFDTDVLQAMLDEAGVEDVSAKDVELIWFDDNSIFNGGTGVAPTKKGTRNTTAVTKLVNYIDGFRVYNPLGTDPDVYTESNVSYANVIDNLAPVSSSDGSAINELFGIAFITGLGSDVTSVSFEEYKQSGPKGELYLNAGKAISFKIDRGENEKVMLGLRAVNGATTINVNGHAIDKGVNSATEMYYDISNCIENTGEDVIITVENTGSGLVAVNHIKFSGGSGSNGTVVTPRSMVRSADATEATTNKFLPITQEDLVAIETVMNAEPIPTVVKNGVVIPLVEEEEEIPEDNTNAGDNNTNDGTDTEESENEEFSLFSLIEMLIAFIEKILYNAFGAGSIA